MIMHLIHLYINLYYIYISILHFNIFYNIESIYSVGSFFYICWLSVVTLVDIRKCDKAKTCWANVFSVQQQRELN